MNNQDIIEEQSNSPTFFHYMLAHDIKSPINQVKGLLYVLKKSLNDEEELLKILNLAIASNERLYAKVEDLLENCNNDQKRTEEINFSNLLEGIKKNLSTMQDDENIKLIENIDESINYYGDPVLLHSIIQNLLENAIKYRKKGSKECVIIISIQQSAENIVLKITDNGIGINENKLPYIFERNYRANDDEKGGSGVGLYLVKKTLNELNASINVKSEVDAGSTFTIVLPSSPLQKAV
ncbi:hypothetical protein GCM10027429_01350 [Marivirga atlantica]|jgi:signal transduction histidine kinase|uniref:histidine kinase n=1 Tax=Marivirga atlantica TaxID=1548457 RepID=A0A937A521_9BACT|nr:HAMP domain-containing sensor histidine kinase [Marivirga atlantica]MBL0763747.1 HAMP domain-containing histidine kinase [Marivirga atlantica]